MLQFKILLKYYWLEITAIFSAWKINLIAYASTLKQSCHSLRFLSQYLMFTFLTTLELTYLSIIENSFYPKNFSFKDFICILYKLKIYLESDFVWISAFDLF